MTLLTMMILPLEDFRRSGRAYLVTRKAVSILRIKPRFQSIRERVAVSLASLVELGLEMLVIPALLTTISSVEILERSSFTALSSVRSALNPLAPISFALSCIRSEVDVMKTVAPNSRNARAVAEPIPPDEPAPVTSADFP